MAVCPPHAGHTRERKAGGMLHGLDEVDWAALTPVDSGRPGEDVAEVLRQIAQADATSGQAAVDRAYNDLYQLLVAPGRVTDAGTAALPFLVGLALDPRTVERADLVDVLARMADTRASAGHAAMDPTWDTAWQGQWPHLQAVLDDADPLVRRAGLGLIADRTGALLRRWRAETDRSVRVTVLLALGEAAAGNPADSTAGEIRAVLDGAADGEDRLLRVAAVLAAAPLDPDVPPRACPMLLELLTDPALAPEFGKVWYSLRCEYVYDRAAVVTWAVDVLRTDSAATIAFVSGLAEAGNRLDDVDLRRCSLQEAWRLLVAHPSMSAALLPVAAGMLGDPDDDVRYRAAYLLAVLGRRAAAHADRLARLLDDRGESLLFDGTVGDLARWALTRIGDPRALPDLVERLVAPWRDLQGRGYAMSEPRLPDIADVLRPLRAHAGVLLPDVRRALREEVGLSGWLVRDLRAVLQAWGEDPTLPGESEPYPLPGEPSPMDPAEAEATVLACAAGEEPFWKLALALAALIRHGRVSRPVLEALTRLRSKDRRLSDYADYRAFLQDEEIRPRLDEVRALPRCENEAGR